jgi:hypothetical protein
VKAWRLQPAAVEVEGWGWRAETVIMRVKASEAFALTRFHWGFRWAMAPVARKVAKCGDLSAVWEVLAVEEVPQVVPVVHLPRARLEVQASALAAFPRSPNRTRSAGVRDDSAASRPPRRRALTPRRACGCRVSSPRGCDQGNRSSRRLSSFRDPSLNPWP